MTIHSRLSKIAYVKILLLMLLDNDRQCKKEALVSVKSLPINIEVSSVSFKIPFDGLI